MLPQALNHMINAFMIMIAEITEARLKAAPPDVIIRPQISTRVGLLNGFERAAETIASGAGSRRSRPARDPGRLIERRQAENAAPPVSG